MSIAIAPLRGWMLDRVVELDAYHTGFAGSYLRASNERRQVIAAYCAKSGRDDIDYAAAAEFLSRAGHKSILQAAYHDVPIGLRRALGKAGAQPHDRRFYATLHACLEAPRHPAIATAIRRMDEIDFGRLRIINMLPQEICTPRVTDVVGDVATAKDVVHLIELLEANGVDPQALGRAICSVNDAGQLSKLWDRWIGDCVLDPTPLDAVPGCQPVRTPRDLFKLARRYRNCAARYATEVLEGTSAFGELTRTDERPEMVVHLRNRRNGWTIDDLFLKNNGRPNPDVREAAYQLLEAGGIKRPGRAAAPNSKWSSLRRLSSRPFWDFGDDG